MTNSVNEQTAAAQMPPLLESAEALLLSTVLVIGEERNLRRFDLDPSSVQGHRGSRNHYACWRG